MKSHASQSLTLSPWLVTTSRQASNLVLGSSVFNIECVDVPLQLLSPNYTLSRLLQKFGALLFKVSLASREVTVLLT